MTDKPDWADEAGLKLTSRMFKEHLLSARHSMTSGYQDVARHIATALREVQRAAHEAGRVEGQDASADWLVGYAGDEAAAQLRAATLWPSRTPEDAS